MSKYCGYCNNSGIVFGIAFGGEDWTWAYQGELYDQALIRRNTESNFKTAGGPCICFAGDRRTLKLQARKNQEALKDG